MPLGPLDVAQWIEHRSAKVRAAGSIPARRDSLSNRASCLNRKTALFLGKQSGALSGFCQADISETWDHALVCGPLSVALPPFVIEYKFNHVARGRPVRSETGGALILAGSMAVDQTPPLAVGGEASFAEKSLQRCILSPGTQKAYP